MSHDVVGALLLGLLQGLTEFLPISSSGHLAAFQILAPTFAFPGVTLELATHLGTTVAVLVYYRGLLRAFLQPAADRAVLLGLSRTRWLLLLAVATLPTAVVGLLGRDWIRAAFDDLHWISAGLLLSGAVLQATRWARAEARALTAADALLIGAAQGVAIFPGVTRSGLTISAALLLGVQRRQAVTFSLLLSVPAVLGASALDAVQTVAGSAPAALLFRDLLFATLAAGIVGYYCIDLVHRATRSRRWHRFAWYCWALALGLVVAAR